MFASIVAGALLFAASANSQSSPAATDMMSILPISTSASGEMSILPISTSLSSETGILVTRPGPPTATPSQSGPTGVLSIPAGETPISNPSTVVSTTTRVSSGSTSASPTATSSTAPSSAPNAAVPARAVDAGVFGAMLGFAWALL